jgi:hypothetical protein
MWSADRRRRRRREHRGRRVNVRRLSRRRRERSCLRPVMTSVTLGFRPRRHWAPGFNGRRSGDDRECPKFPRQPGTGSVVSVHDRAISGSASIAGAGKQKPRPGGRGDRGCLEAGEQGFEPQLADPESAVLPLDDSPTLPPGRRTEYTSAGRFLQLGVGREHELRNGADMNRPSRFGRPIAADRLTATPPPGPARRTPGRRPAPPSMAGRPAPDGRAAPGPWR